MIQPKLPSTHDKVAVILKAEKFLGNISTTTKMSYVALLQL